LTAPSLLIRTTANFAHLAQSLLFIPFDKNGFGNFPVLVVGWTLNYEMYFYSVFALAILAGPKCRGILTAAAIIVILLATSASTDLPVSAYKNSIIVEFIFGMLAFNILHTRKILIAENAVYLALILLPLILGVATVVDRGYSVGVPVFAVFMVAVAIFRNVKIGALANLLGASSYALYLTHVYVVRTFLNLPVLSGGSLYFRIAVGLAVYLVCVAVSIAIFRYFERPVTRYLRARFVGEGPHGRP
jgi:exopolysaccharide production protein ExoZ